MDLILTGQGSTSDITVKNDADATVFSIPTGTDDVLFPDDAKIMLGDGSDMTLHWDATDAHITVAGTLNIDGSGETMATFADDGGVALYFNNIKGIETASNTLVSYSTSDKAAIKQDSTGIFIVLDGTDASSTDAGDNVIMDRSAAGTDVGDDILSEDHVFLHSGMQRNVINIVDAGGTVLNSVAGFAPGVI
jgi:hypothetical protein